MKTNKQSAAVQQDQKDQHSQQQKHQQQKTRQTQGAKKQGAIIQHHEQELPETRMFR